MHSCPHLRYLNYICNAYRGAVGTEYVGATPRRRRRRRYALTRRRTHNVERSRAFSEHTQTHTAHSHAILRACVRLQKRVEVPYVRCYPMYRIEFRV